jgi:hypothetical protein
MARARGHTAACRLARLHAEELGSLPHGARPRTTSSTARGRGRRRLYSMLGLLASLSLLLLRAGGASASGRPNLLFLQCDEMDGRVLDPSHPLSRVTSMPHLAALAARGVNFVQMYAENPLCAPSRASTWTGRRTASIRTWNNVKALTTMIGQPDVADPTCEKVVGYGTSWCVAEGRKQNVSSVGSIRHALVALGYRVQLYGKMDTGGGVCRPEVDICNANGYHDTGNWSVAPDRPPVRTYYHGDLIHSWAGEAGISKPVFQPLLAENGWINETNPDGGPCALDWPTIRRCADWIAELQGDGTAAPPPPPPVDGHSSTEGGAGGGGSPWMLYCSVIDPHPPYFVRAWRTT